MQSYKNFPLHHQLKDEEKNLFQIPFDVYPQTPNRLHVADVASGVVEKAEHVGQLLHHGGGQPQPDGDVQQRRQ